MIASFRRIAWVLTLSSLVTWSLGCTDDLTEIMVVVDSDQPTPQAFDMVTIQIDGMGAPREVTTDLNARPLPLWLGVVNEGDKLGPITVTVTGKLGSTTQVTAVREEVRFQKGKTLMLRVDLLRACVTNPSACSLTCDDDTPCLLPWNGPPQKLDAAVSDSGPVDAGNDSGSDDSGSDDAGVDAAGDAGDAMPEVDAGLDPCSVADAVCFNYAPSNFDPLDLGAALAENAALSITCGDAVFDSTTRMYTGACAAPLQSVVVTQPSGPDAVVIPVTSLTVTGGGALRLIGERPVIFAVFGEASINGAIHASAVQGTPGAGGNVSCTSGTGGVGQTQTANDRGGSGGGGGGFGTVGATGGRGDRGTTTAAGMVEGDDTLAPLRGGCAGGRGGQGTGTDGGNLGGAGGGAVQISVAGALSFGGVVAAGGGGGSKGILLQDGGGGGGSGGAVLLECERAEFGLGAWVSANGGGGGGGFDHNNDSDNSQPGVDGPAASVMGGAGGAGDNRGGDGGRGGGASAAATAGQNGEAGSVFTLEPYGAAGGGGGGGTGRLRVRDNTRSSTACTLPGNFSPAAIIECGG